MEVGTLLEEARTRMRERYLLPSPGKRRTLRQRSGLAQSDLARLLGVTASAVSRYETGERTPRSDVLRLYLELLGRLQLAFNDEDLAGRPGLVTTSAPHGRHVAEE